MLALTPEATAMRLRLRYGTQKALTAALDYRFNLYDYGTPGYVFWSEVVTLLVRQEASTRTKVLLTFPEKHETL